MNRRRIIITIASLFTLCAGLFAKGDTYIYDYWTEIEKSPDVYRVSSVLYADDLDLEVGLKNPSSLFTIDNIVYICDTDNNRIIELEYKENKTVSLIRVIDHFYSDDPSIDTTLAGPMDIFVNVDGSIFIADTNHGRVVKLDADLNYITAFTEPDDPTYEKGKTFFPQKVVADSKGRTYILAKNVNKGFLKYEYDGSFTGFYGASEVVYNWTDYIWKRLSTRAQREQMENFVPTEYSNATIDSDGFIYCVTKTFEQWDLLSDKAKPIRKLNALGDDILVKNNKDHLPVGDLKWGNAAGIKEPSHFTDITVLDNEVYLTIDESRGRIFGYNNQGYLLFAFGNKGNINGCFRSPSSIENVGKDIFVLDTMNASLTIFTPTEYGELIYAATELYSDGKYDDSADTWAKVLEQNGNYDLAYIGLGKSCFRQEQYKSSMDYFRLKRDAKLYSKTFKYYRKEWIEANIGIIMVILIVLIVVPIVVKRIKAIRKELESL